jgi:hypothetical protein
MSSIHLPLVLDIKKLSEQTSQNSYVVAVEPLITDTAGEFQFCPF